MRNIKILDCTLRDGGYINNWEFSKKIGTAISTSLLESKVDIIECGYLTTKNSQNITTLFNSFEQLESYYKDSINKKSEITSLVVMINYGDFPIDNLPTYTNGIVQGIRLAFHKKDIEKVVADAQIIIDKGYKLFFQPMVMKTYSEIEFINLIEKANSINPYSFYLVDSFGSLDKKEFMRYFLLADHLLNKDIVIGFHGHNNMQFVYANAIHFIENSTDRDIIIDASVFGMGRGAGNLNTEIILDYINKYYNGTYLVDPLLEVMDDYLETLYKSNPWGFTPAQYLSAKHDCHPNYATYLTRKKKLTIAGINKILASISEENKKEFSEVYIEKKYLEFNKNNPLSNVLDTDIFREKEILLIGSGHSIDEFSSKIEVKSQSENTLTVSLNSCVKRFNPDYYFFSNQKRYDEYADEIKASKLIVTSNIRILEKHQTASQVKYEILLNKDLKNVDNVLVLMLSLLQTTHVINIYLAGFDGYRNESENYSNEKIILNDQNEMDLENEKIYMSLEYFSKKLSIEFLTPSIFKKAVELKILGVIPARYKSSRFEGKPLCIIKNIPMIKRTYMQAKKSQLLSHLVVATDSKKIESYCHSENIPVVMTNENCLTGTDRIAEVATQEHFDLFDLYVNIQGDEPVIDPISIDEVVEEFKEYGEEYIAYNLYKFIESDNEVDSDTIIKTIVNEKDELMYMSRLAVPFNKSNNEVTFKKQVCVYGFTKKALEVFSARDKTLNEQFEDIEILRFIDMGYKVKMRETKVDSIAVDIPDDIKKVENFLVLKGLN